MTRTLSPEAQIAANTRTAITAARRDGTLDLPNGAKVSVRCDNASLYAAVNVNITAPHDWERTPEGRLSAEALTVADRVLAILREHRTDGYVWCNVTVNHASAGTIPSDSWRPGED